MKLDAYLDAYKVIEGPVYIKGFYEKCRQFRVSLHIITNALI